MVRESESKPGMYTIDVFVSAKDKVKSLRFFKTDEEQQYALEYEVKRAGKYGEKVK